MLRPIMAVMIWAKVASCDIPGALIVSVTNHTDAVGNRKNFLEPVRNIDDGDALIAEAANDLKEPLGFAFGQRGIRLIHNDDFRLLLKRARNFDELLFADGQIFRLSHVRVNFDVHHGKHIARGLVHFAVVEQTCRRQQARG